MLKLWRNKYLIKGANPSRILKKTEILSRWCQFLMRKTKGKFPHGMFEHCITCHETSVLFLGKSNFTRISIIHGSPLWWFHFPLIKKTVLTSFALFIDPIFSENQKFLICNSLSPHWTGYWECTFCNSFLHLAYCLTPKMLLSRSKEYLVKF